MPSLSDALRAIAVDVGPFRRSRDFRRLTVSAAVSTLGNYATLVAGPIQIKHLTNSTVAVGLLGAVELLPIVVFGLLGGAIADHYDRRRVALYCDLASLVLSGLLAFNAWLPHPSLWAVYVITSAAAVSGSIRAPSEAAMVPRYVDHADLAAASALSSTIEVGGSLLGPALGGILASYHLPLAYALDAATFAVSALLVVGLTRLARTGEALTGWRDSFASIGAGLAYARGRPDLLGSYLVDTIAMVTAVPMALFAFFAPILHAPWAVGLLFTAESVGSLLMTVTSGWTSRIHRHGWAIIVSAAAWGAAVAVAGLMPSLWLVLLFLTVSGAADMCSGLFRQALWNQTIPAEFRGRLAGIELLSYSIGPTVGNARAGLMALGGIRFSLTGGGLLCVLGVSGAAGGLKALRSYDVRTDVHAEAVRAAGVAT